MLMLGKSEHGEEFVDVERVLAQKFAYLNVLPDSEIRNQVIKLKDESQIVSPVIRKLLAFQVFHECSGDTHATRIDIIADADTPSADSELMHESLQAEIGNVLAILPQNERDVIKMSFGIDQQHPCTLSEIAMLMGVSRERVRQMHKNAIKRLSHSSAKERLRAYL